MSKRLIPLLDRVLVERVVAATKTSGGILLPETAASKVRPFYLFLFINSDFCFHSFLESSSSSSSSSSHIDT